MTEQTVHVRQHLLGLEPYVLILLRPAQPDEEDLRATVEYGGGITAGDVRDVLEMTLDSLPGSTDDG